MRILILGATGAAGGSLLDAALPDPRITSVRTITRRPLPVTATKFRGYVLADLGVPEQAAEAFMGIDVCFWCVGRAVSQVPDPAEYHRLTVELPLRYAAALRQHSPEAVFHYLSGQGASATTRQRWAQVKYQAEQTLRMQFDAVCWRPGAIDATRQDGWPWHYRFVMPLVRVLLPLRSVYVRGSDLARAMLQAAASGAHDRVYENREIRSLADASRLIAS